MVLVADWVASEESLVRAASWEESSEQRAASADAKAVVDSAREWEGSGVGGEGREEERMEGGWGWIEGGDGLREEMDSSLHSPPPAFQLFKSPASFTKIPTVIFFFNQPTNSLIHKHSEDICYCAGMPCGCCCCTGNDDYV